MTRSEFTGVVEAARQGGAFVQLPDEVLTSLAGGKRFRVVGTANEVPFESSTIAMDGRVFLGLHKATRERAGVAVGDEVRLVVERDDRPREVTVPADLAEALGGDDAARTKFEALAFTHRKEYVEWVTSAKRAETRARRVTETLARLRS